VIGMKRDLVLARFLTGMPKRFAVASGPAVLSAVVVELAEETGRCRRIEPLYLTDE
jgi:calcineurin-like phosphoesterase